MFRNIFLYMCLYRKILLTHVENEKVLKTFFFIIIIFF